MTGSNVNSTFNYLKNGDQVTETTTLWRSFVMTTTWRGNFNKISYIDWQRDAHLTGKSVDKNSNFYDLRIQTYTSASIKVKFGGSKGILATFQLCRYWGMGLHTQIVKIW